MKTILCLICLMFVISCSTTTTQLKDIEIAEKICEQNGGISSIEMDIGPFAVHRLNIWCKNGAFFEANNNGNVYRDFTKKPSTDQKE